MIKGLKNSIALILALSVLSSLMTIPAFAATPVVPVELYSNAFSNAENDYAAKNNNVSATNDYGTSTVYGGGWRLKSRKFNGNVGIAMDKTKSGSDFVGWEQATPVTNGTVSIAFDMAISNDGGSGDEINGKNSNKPSVLTVNGSKIMQFGVDENTNITDIAAWYKIMGCCYDSETAEWNVDNSAANVGLTEGTLYNVKIYIDVTNGMLYETVGGETLCISDLPAGFNFSSLKLNVTKTFRYFDNFKIEWYQNLSMSVEDAQKDGDSSLILTFDENIIDLKTEGYTVKNIITGETAAATAAAVADEPAKLKLTASGMTFEEGYKYLLSIPPMPGLAKNYTYEISVGTDYYLENIKFKDYLGNAHEIKTADNPAEAKEFSVWFSSENQESANTVFNSITITPKDGIALARDTGKSSLTPEGEGVYRADITLETYLTGSTEYAISITCPAKTYSITYKTKEGDMYVNYKFKKGDTVIENLDTVSDGETVKLEVTVFDTYNDTQAAQIAVASTSPSYYYAYCTLWNGLDMKHFDFAAINKETGGTATFEVAIADVSDAVVTGYVWQDEEDIVPIWTEASISKTPAE